MFENITHHIDDCLMELDKRIASGAPVDPADMQYGDLLAHFAKSLDTHVAMQEAGSGYSGRDYRDGSGYHDGSTTRGNSYRDGYGIEMRPPYPVIRKRSGYSRAERIEELEHAMSGAMGEMPEDLRREAQRFLTKMNQQM